MPFDADGGLRQSVKKRGHVSVEALRFGNDTCFILGVKSMNGTWIARTGLAVALGLSVGGCDLLQAASQNSDCVTHETGYNEVLQTEGALSPTIDSAEAYPMSLAVSLDALNRLFAAVAEGDLPPITLSDSFLGAPVSVTLDPSLPLIQFGNNLCPTCLLTEFDFGLSVSVAGGTVGGTGAAVYQFPLLMRDNGQESTTVFGQFGQSEVVSVNIAINGLDPSLTSFLNPLIADAATALIQGKAQPYGVDGLGDTELFSLKSWNFLGETSDVKLLSRGPHIHPEAGTIVMGLQSNLIRPEDSLVQVDPQLPIGADIGLQIHPGLVQAMIGRMMHEGEIDRTYDENGNVNAEGSHAVTMGAMGAGEDNLLRTSFRLWRTQGGFCGYADLQADLGLSISNNEMKLTAQNIQVVNGEGSGLLLQQAGNWLSSQFTDDMVEFSQKTINYKNIELPEGKRADMSADTFQLNIDGRGLSVFLNIDQIIDAN